MPTSATRHCVLFAALIACGERKEPCESAAAQCPKSPRALERDLAHSSVRLGLF